MKPVFIALIEVRPLPGCQLDPKEYNGASVRCYVPAHTEVEARMLFNKTLALYRFYLMSEDFFVQEDKVEWDKPDSKAGMEAIAEARRTNEVVFSKFNAWGHDDPDAFK